MFIPVQIDEHPWNSLQNGYNIPVPSRDSHGSLELVAMFRHIVPTKKRISIQL